MTRGLLTVRWNQALSFSPLLTAGTRGDKVFWPGCAAMKLEPGVIAGAYRLLRSRHPDLGFSGWCCGKPTFAVDGPRQRERRRDQVLRYVWTSSIEGVYTLCPNCRMTLQELGVPKVESAWPELARAYSPADGVARPMTGRYRLHDPCAARADVPSQLAVRRLLEATGARWEGFARRGTHTRCCGRRDMLFVTDPKAAKKMLADRIEEAEGAPIVSYCESCVEAFRSAGAEAYHVLELMAGAPAKRSQIHRIRNARTGGRP